MQLASVSKLLTCSVRSDARLEMVGQAEGNAIEIMKARYCTNYANLPWAWKLELANVDGAEMIVHYRQTEQGWQPHATMRLVWLNSQVITVQDYFHVEYLLDGAVVRRGF